jgi:hypothetical protein
MKSLDFMQQQLAFAAHLRDPIHSPAPEGLSETRLRIYRDLFYRNIEGFIASALPNCKRVLGEDEWQRLVRDFYAKHRCASPYFLEISREFLDYLWALPDPLVHTHFLKALALFEWLDLHVQISDAQPPVFQPNGDLLLQRPLVSPWLVLQSFMYPVQNIGAECLSVAALDTPVFLVIYRDRQHHVHRFELNAVSARCLSLLQSQTMSGQAILHQVADELAYDDLGRQSLLNFGAQTLQYWLSKDILLGTLD